MRNILRFELARALGGARFRVSAAAGVTVALLHFFTDVLPLTKWLDAWEKDPYLTPHSVYGHWIGMDLSTVWPVLLFTTLPLLAAFPAADSYWCDRDSGYLAQIRLRCRLTQYKAAKAAAVFVSAFAVALIPLLADLLLTGAALPCILPEAASGLYPIGERDLFGALFYRRPMLYLLGYTAFDCLWIALWTTLALSLSRWLKQRFEVLLAPFLLHLLLYFVSLWSGVPGASPMAFLLPFQPTAEISPVIPAGMAVGLLALAGLMFFPEGRCRDVR